MTTAEALSINLSSQWQIHYSPVHQNKPENYSDSIASGRGRN